MLKIDEQFSCTGCSAFLTNTRALWPPSLGPCSHVGPQQHNWAERNAYETSAAFCLS